MILNFARAAVALAAALWLTPAPFSQAMAQQAKYVAKLRTLKTDTNPLVFNINMAGGHGGSSGRYDRLRETAFDFAFILMQLGTQK